MLIFGFVVECFILGKLKSNLSFITLVKIPKGKGSISPSSLYSPVVDQRNEKEKVSLRILFVTLGI